MGIYTYTAFYFGRLLTKETRDKLDDEILKANNIEIKNLNDPRGRYVIHPKDCYIVISSLDFYTIDDLRKVLTPDRVVKLKSDANASKEKIEKILSDFVDFYKIECSWSTLDNIHDMHVTSNIRINFDNS